MTEQKVSEHRERRYEDGCRDERHRCEKVGATLREVYSDGHKNDEVRREHREQQQTRSERRRGLGVLQGPKPPGGFARLATHVALDGQEYEQPDEQVLDDVAE